MIWLESTAEKTEGCDVVGALENGVIRSYGQDLDRVKEQAEQEAKENGMEYFIT